MKIPEQLCGSAINIANEIIRRGVRRDSSVLRAQIIQGELKIFEKNGDDTESFTQTAYVEPKISHLVITRLKELGKLSVIVNRKAQAGTIDFRFGGTPNIGRKITIISTPDFNGNDEVIIDLAP
jgi:type II secretory ATPase GspE/PulE/Tfp pilus assembly ATPase PilB-like protein